MRNIPFAGREWSSSGDRSRNSAGVATLIRGRGEAPVNRPSSTRAGPAAIASVLALGGSRPDRSPRRGNDCPREGPGSAPIDRHHKI